MNGRSLPGGSPVLPMPKLFVHTEIGALIIFCASWARTLRCDCSVLGMSSYYDLRGLTLYREKLCDPIHSPVSLLDGILAFGKPWII